MAKYMDGKKDGKEIKPKQPVKRGDGMPLDTPTPSYDPA